MVTQSLARQGSEEMPKGGSEHAEEVKTVSKLVVLERISEKNVVVAIGACGVKRRLY